LNKETELRQEYQALESRLWNLDRRLADALNRIKHDSAPDAVEQARRDERTILTELDRLMTRARAIGGADSSDQEKNTSVLTK
jgi:hypothetical protein